MPARHDQPQDTPPAPSTPIRADIRFHGRVQGVGFRATAAQAASRHAVTGWVRNEPDATVRMVLEGSPSAVEAALADLRSMMGGHIEREDRSDAPPTGEFRRFEIRR
ncbi:MAG: acylphosphatase [Phycisphaerales bacterium]